MTGHATSLAAQVAATVHELTLTTRPALTELTTSDLLYVTNALAEMAAAMPQLLRQLSHYANGNNDAIGQAVHTELQRAAIIATHLYTAVDTAQQTLGDPAETTRNQPEGSIFNRRQGVSFRAALTRARGCGGRQVVEVQVVEAEHVN